MSAAQSTSARVRCTVRWGLASLLAAGCGATATSHPGCPAGATSLEPRTVARGQFTGLAWSDGDLIATGPSDVFSIRANGDPPVTLAHMSQVQGVVVAGGAAYFSAAIPLGAPNATGMQAITAALFSVPLSGGVPTLVLGSAGDMNGAVTDGTAIYFNGFGDGIVRVAVADGAHANLAIPADVSVLGLAVYAGNLYLAARDSSPRGGSILKLPATGGATTTLASNIDPPAHLVAGPSGLAWVAWPVPGQDGSPRIARAELDGSEVTTLAAHAADALVLDGDTLYIENGGISRVPARGGAEVTLFPNLDKPGLLSVSNGQAAWVSPYSQVPLDTTPWSLVTTCW